MDEMKRDKNRIAKPETLAVLQQLLATGDIKSAHYIGYAHEPILRLLIEHLGSSCSVGDYWDRYHCGAAFFADEDVVHLIPERPKWLEGIPFFFEGLPQADLYVQDVPLDGDSCLTLLRRRGRLPPDYILLADEAKVCAGDPDYDWTITPDYALGGRKERCV